MDDSDLKSTIIKQGDESLGATQSFGVAVASGAKTLIARRKLPKLRVSFSSNPSDSDFVVLEELGSGGVGIVELAQQTLLSRQVAVKRVRDPSKADHVQSLLREANVTGQLEHPNIIPIHTIGEDDVVGVFVAMKHVQGRTWAEILHSTSDEAFDHLAILTDVCQAVAFAHSQGIVHRDLKPENVMIGEFGEVYVVDWGLAMRLTEEKEDGPIIGTPAYMAPEMSYGRVSQIDTRTDVYLLGAMLFEVLEGRPPHLGETSMESLIQACQNEPFVFTTPLEPLTHIVQKACRTERDERFDSASEFRDALVEYLDHRVAFEMVQRAVVMFDEAMTAEASERFEELGQARFGFEQALNVWSEVRGAKEGLRATLSELVSLELEFGNLDRAERLLKEIDRPSSDLRSRVQDARQRSDQLEEAEQKLRKIEKETDVRSGANARLILGIVTFLFALISPIVITQWVGGEPTSYHMFLATVFFFFAFSTTHLALYRRIPQTIPNRAVIGAIYIAIIGSTINRMGGWAFESDPSHVGVADLMVFSVAIYSIRKLLRSPRLVIATMLLGSYLIIIFPEYQRLTFNAALVLSLGWVVFDWNNLKD